MLGDNDFGPIYGNNPDLYLSDDCNENDYSSTKLSGCYEGESDPFQLNGGTKHFKVLDYEMWQIVKY